MILLVSIRECDFHCNCGITKVRCAFVAVHGPVKRFKLSDFHQAVLVVLAAIALNALSNFLAISDEMKKFQFCHECLRSL